MKYSFKLTKTTLSWFFSTFNLYCLQSFWNIEELFKRIQMLDKIDSLKVDLIKKY